MKKYFLLLPIALVLVAVWYIVGQSTATQVINKENQTADSADSTASVDSVRIRLVGTWKSDEDQKFIRAFMEDGTVADDYEGTPKASSAGTWELFSAQNPVDTFTGTIEPDSDYLRIRMDGIDLHYKVTALSEDTLELVYLDRGGVLSFTRVR